MLTEPKEEPEEYTPTTDLTYKGGENVMTIKDNYKYILYDDYEGEQ